MTFLQRPLTVAGQRWNRTNFAAARQLRPYRTCRVAAGRQSVTHKWTSAEDGHRLFVHLSVANYQMSGGPHVVRVAM
jgi:hypothetical protein